MAIPTEYVPSVFYWELKTNYSICHNHWRSYRRNTTRRYFTESCKNITANATITDAFPNGFIDGKCKFQCVRLSGRSTQLPMEASNAMRACSDTYLPTDSPTNFEKSGGIFKILVRNSKNTDGHYQQNLMSPSKKILFHVSSGNPSVKLQYKTDPPSTVHFFLGSSHSSYLLLCFLKEFLYCYDCSFQHIKRYDSPLFIFVFGYFFFTLVMIIFVVFFFFCIVCR
jgi:hypothetical protein